MQGFQTGRVWGDAGKLGSHITAPLRAQCLPLRTRVYTFVSEDVLTRLHFELAARTPSLTTCLFFDQQVQNYRLPAQNQRPGPQPSWGAHPRLQNTSPYMHNETQMSCARKGAPRCRVLPRTSTVLMASAARSKP